MAANFCLVPAAISKFKQALIEGDLNPSKLVDMTSQERHELFSKIVGEENATGVNALFESKTLLKNQEQGMITWAKKVSGVSPEVRRDLITRIQKLDHVLDPAEEKQFLHDLASTRLGVDVTAEEAKTIAKLSREIETTKAAMASGGDRLAYGRAKVDMGAYVSELKHSANKLTLGGAVRNPGKFVTHSAGLLKSLKASLDDSAIFRQGWKSLLTNPVKWQKNARQTFSDIWKELGGHDAMREVHADIVSRPNYDRYVKAKLATSTIEEAFPSQLPEKIPGVKRLFKASESAYTGFLHRQRADIFDKYIEIAQKQGVNIDDAKQLQSIGKLVNSLTGRGHLGGLEPAANTVNSVFFSPRSLKGNIDTLTAHQFQKGVTPFVRKQAAENLVKIVVGTGSVLALANAIKPGSVEFDPRSSDFGKIKVGNTRFDVTGGMAGILTLGARLATQSSKSSTTGAVTKLNSGYGSQTGADVVSSFLQNKLSPAASIAKDLISQKDFNGKKPTLKGEASNAFVPLPITTYQELKGDPNAANAILGLIADGLGINTNTYGKSTTDWTQNPTKEIQQFQQKVGDQKFKQAMNEYNQTYDQWYQGADVLNIPHLKDVPADQKAALSQQAKQDIQSHIFKEYGFKYEMSQQEKDQRKQKAKATKLKNLQDSAIYR